MGQYYLKKLKRYCTDRGLFWNEAIYQATLPKIKAAKLSQRQFDQVMEAHIDAVCMTFDASNLPLKQRFVIAVHFIFGCKFPKQ